MLLGRFNYENPVRNSLFLCGCAAAEQKRIEVNLKILTATEEGKILLQKLLQRYSKKHVCCGRI